MIGVKWFLLPCEFVGGPLDGDSYVLQEPTPGKVYEFESEGGRVLRYRFYSSVAKLLFCGYVPPEKVAE